MRFIFLLPILLPACALGGRGVDAPVAVPADYAAREAAQMVDTDRCGPAFIQNKLPAAMQSAIGPVADGPFRPVCARHDACYRLGEKTQSWCDDRMKTEMLGICETGEAGPGYAIPVIGPSLCRFHAGMYFNAINTTFGSVAYGDDEPAGEITNLRIHRIKDRFSDDELTICVDVLNPSKLMQEYDVELHTDDGRRIDREPDTHETNVRPGEQEEFCVGTNFTPMWGVSDLTDTVHLSVRADTPTTFAITGDMVVVDTRAVRVTPAE